MFSLTCAIRQQLVVLVRPPLSIKFELQHFLDGMEALLRSVVVVSLSRPGVELLCDGVAFALRHVAKELAFPKWVPSDVSTEARRLSKEEALQSLGSWCS